MIPNVAPLKNAEKSIGKKRVFGWHQKQILYLKHLQILQNTVTMSMI
jgi:hypothetical protein